MARFRPAALAAFVYLLLTAALTWPLALHPRTLIPSDIGDPLLNIWILWWNTQAVPLTEAWWNAPQFAPIQGALAFSEHLLGLTPITTPVILLTGDAVLAYNLAFFLAFPLCALATHFLVYSIARRHDIAFIAGLAFAFAPYRLPQIAHLQVLSAYWMPLALAGLHRFFADGRRRWLALFAVAWFFQALACGYYFFFLSVLVVLWLLWFARPAGRRLVHVLGAWAFAVLALAPVLYGYWRISRAYHLRRSLTEIRNYSADIGSVLMASELSRTWDWLHVVRRPESDLFPGATVLAVSIVALVLAWRYASRQSAGHPRTARVALALAAIAGTVTAARIAQGPFKLHVGGLQLLSVTSPEKPISVFVLCLLIAALLHPAVRTAWRRRSALAFYAVAAVAMWLLSLGPEPTLLNKPALYKAPYAWLLMIPGMDGVRVPARFWMLGILCLAVTAALGVRLLVQRWPRVATVLPAVVIAGLLIDGLPNPLPMVPRPAERPNHAAAQLRLDLPLGPDVDTLALFRAIGHRRPLVNGYSGYFAPHYWALRRLLDERNPRAVERLAAYGALEIMVDHELDPDGGWRLFAETIPGAQPVHRSGSYSSYLVPRRNEPAPVPSGARLPFRVAHASENQALAHEVQDGNLYTRWHAGREQRNGDALVVDLEQEREVSGVELLLGGYLIDFPRRLNVATSLDNMHWTTAWEGEGALMALSGGLARPAEMPLPIPLTQHRARYVRFTQTGTELVNYWTIAELRILGK